MQRFTEFVINHWDLFLTAVFLAGMLVWQMVRGRVGGYTDIDANGAVALINRQEAVVVDVREEGELKEGRLADAIHIPVGSLKSRVNELERYKEKPVIVMCRSGHRSAHACSVLHKNGFTTLYNLRGGIGAWQSANLPVVRGGKSKKR